MATMHKLHSDLPTPIAWNEWTTEERYDLCPSALQTRAQTLAYVYVCVHQLTNYTHIYYTYTLTYLRRMHLHSSTSISSKEEHKSLLHDCHNWQLYFHFHLGIAASNGWNSKAKQNCEGDSKKVSTIRQSRCVYVCEDLHLWSGLAHPCPHTLNDCHPFVFATSFTRPRTLLYKCRGCHITQLCWTAYKLKIHQIWIETPNNFYLITRIVPFMNTTIIHFRKCVK